MPLLPAGNEGGCRTAAAVQRTEEIKRCMVEAQQHEVSDLQQQLPKCLANREAGVAQLAKALESAEVAFNEQLAAKREEVERTPNIRGMSRSTRVRQPPTRKTGIR
jgi:hypothetical protein